MSSATLPPKTNNGVLNSVFNSSDFAIAANDARYLKLSGGTISGALAVNNTTTTNGITSLSGTNQFFSNINLPTTYTSAPNITFPSTSQLGGVTSAYETSGFSAATGVIKSIKSITLSAGVYSVVFRGVISPTAAGTGTYSNVRISLSTNLDAADGATEYNRVAICSTETATQGAANGYEVALIGSCILQVSAQTTYYLNGCSVFTSTQPSKWTGHIQAVRIA